VQQGKALLSSAVRSDEKVAIPETGEKKRKRTARGTDVSSVISLSISPVDAAQTPPGGPGTSGKELSTGLIRYPE